MMFPTPDDTMKRQMLKNGFKVTHTYLANVLW